MRYILFITLTVFAGCSSRDVGKGAPACDTLTISKLKTAMLGKEMTGLPSYACLVSRDRVLDYMVIWNDFPTQEEKGDSVLKVYCNFELSNR
jgi:hypothetical protein